MKKQKKLVKITYDFNPECKQNFKPRDGSH